MSSLEPTAQHLSVPAARSAPSRAVTCCFAIRLQDRPGGATLTFTSFPLLADIWHIRRNYVINALHLGYDLERFFWHPIFH
ncbi:MAG: hypothetical protein ACI8RE_003299 [Ilumatobacter sp.]|jgi:hypothetical protein